MFNQIQKSQYKFLGLLYTMVGAALIGLTVNIAMNPQKPADTNADSTKVVAACNKNIIKNYKAYNINLDSGLKNSIRYVVTTKKDVITIKRSGLKGSQYVLKDVEGMMGVCQGMKIQSFCMGSSCKNVGAGGMIMELKYNGEI